MVVAAVVAIVLGVAVAAPGFVWYGPWSLPAILLGLMLACAGLLALCAVGIDQGIKDYIDYAKEKGDGSSRRA